MVCLSNCLEFSSRFVFITEYTSCRLCHHTPCAAVCLSQNNLTELKSFGSPPPAVVNVTAAVMVLLAPGGKVPRDRSWKTCKVRVQPAPY